MPCDWLDGPTADPSGPAPALANLSARQALAEGLMTRGTYGPPSDGSLTSAALQQSLESRLRASLDVDGSPEYVLTWKHWDMESGAPICALRASARRTSGNDCGGSQTGWPTAKRDDGVKSIRSHDGAMKEAERKGANDLNTAAVLAGWPTPTASDSGGPTSHNRTWSKTQVNLHNIVLGRGKQPDGTVLAGWATPAARDFKSESATPEFNDKRNAEVRGKPLSYQATLSAEAPGTTTSGSPAPTAKRGALNGALSLWLQGFPSDWLMVAPERTPRGRKS